MQVVRSLDPAAWRGFLDAQPESNIFHTPEMFQVFAGTKGCRPHFVAAVDESGCPLALLLPVEWTLLGGPLRLFTTRAVVYGGVLCAPGESGQQALALVLREYGRSAARRGILYTELRNVADAAHLQPALCRHGFQHEEHLNYLIDLDRPPNDIFQGIGHRTRKNIRHALNRGNVVVEEITGPADLADCYELLHKTYTATSVPLAHRSLFEAAYAILAPQQMVRFTLARVEGAAAAVSVELLYKDVLYGWYGGTEREYAAYVPNEVLTWQILRWGAENGFRVYDFGGAGKPEEAYGVRDFKAKFGGRLVNYGRDVCVHSPVLMPVARRLYQLVRHTLYGRLTRPRLNTRFSSRTARSDR